MRLSRASHRTFVSAATRRVRVVMSRHKAEEARKGLFDSVAGKVPTLVVTRSENGALARRGDEHAEVAAEPIERLVDTTGAGDLFAAGFLAGEARNLGLKASLKLGAVAAAEIIQHYGARPEKDLKALAGELAA